MEAQPPTETSVHFYRAVRRHVAGDDVQRGHRLESLECL